MSTENSSCFRGNNLWQQILYLDDKYKDRFSRFTTFGIMYYHRRNQLFRELSQKETNNVRKKYLKMRSLILSQRYTNLFEGNRKLESNLDTEIELDVIVSANTEDDLSDRESAESQYAFTGMHHIFDHHKGAVSRVHFANNDKSLLACCSLDGTLSICQLTPSPATVLYILKGHTNGVYDFEWSLSNDLIVSCSLDCTIRLWDTASGACLRVIRDPTFAPVLAATFQPVNNNMIVVGNAKGYVHVVNVSTGISVKGGSLRTNTCSVQCLCFENSGRVLWIGDSRGFVSSFLFELQTGRLMRLTKSLLSSGASITSIFITTIHRETRNKYLLVNRYPNSVIIFLLDNEMRLNYVTTLNVKHQNSSLMIRSVFCPITSRKEGLCIVSGSEDSDVYLFTHIELTNNYMRNSHLSKLQGHSAPVLDVCFNFDESLLATSDLLGNVVVWKKDKIE